MHLFCVVLHIPISFQKQTRTSINFLNLCCLLSKKPCRDMENSIPVLGFFFPLCIYVKSLFEYLPTGYFISSFAQFSFLLTPQQDLNLTATIPACINRSGTSPGCLQRAVTFPAGKEGKEPQWPRISWTTSQAMLTAKEQLLCHHQPCDVPLRVTSEVTRSGCSVKSLYLDIFLHQTKSFILLCCPDFLPPCAQSLFQWDDLIPARKYGQKSRCPSVQGCRMSPSVPSQRPRGGFATGTDKGLITVTGKC